MNLHHFLLISHQDSLARTLLPQTLRREDELRMAANVFDAFALLREAPFDAVLIDLTENDEDVVLCRMVRRHSNVPIVMLTSADTRDQVTRGYNLGADAHIEIPCDPRVLRARLRALTRRAATKTEAVRA